MLAATACTSSGDVLTMKDPDSTADAGADAGITRDGGPAPVRDGGADVTTKTWYRLPGLMGGLFRHAGSGGDSSLLIGRSLDENALSVYVLGQSLEATRHGYPTDDDGGPLPLPVGELAARDGRLLWATDRDGIVASQDDGASWAPLALPWQDGSVGEGNGHVSSIVDAWTTTDAYCVHREVTPWVDFVVKGDDRYNEVRCLRGDTWTVHTSSLAEGMRFFEPAGEHLYGFTGPVYNMETGAPKICHSPDLGATWTCAPTTLAGKKLLVADDGRLVVVHVESTPEPEPSVETQIWLSEDDGETFTLATTVPEALFEVVLVGDILYGLPFWSSVDVIDGELHVVHLESPVRLETGPSPTRAQIYQLSMFEHGGALMVATTRGVRRYAPSEGRWYEVAIESMPALDLMTDATGAVWTIDGTRAARRLTAGATDWEEHFFDDTGWATADVTHHARVYELARAGGDMFFGAAHRKLYHAPAASALPSPEEDQGLTGIVDPGATLWRMAGTPAALYAAVTGGEDVNHGTGSRTPWGGGLYRRNSDTGAWTDIGGALPVRMVGAAMGRAIIGALFVDEGLLLAATHAGVVRSTDDGGQWISPSGIPPWDATTDATHIAGVGTNILVTRSTDVTTSVYVSADRGATFDRISDDLPPGTKIRDLAAAEGTYFALIEPGGVFASEDGGSTWRRVGEVEDERAFDRPFSLIVEPARILAGTAEGVWALDRSEP